MRNAALLKEPKILSMCTRITSIIHNLNCNIIEKFKFTKLLKIYRTNQLEATTIINNNNSNKCRLFF